MPTRPTARISRRRFTRAVAGTTAAAAIAPFHVRAAAKSPAKRKRVALATVLAMEPSVLVFDEPSAGLDPRGRRELIDLLASAKKVWIQTHFNHPREVTPEAARVCASLLKAGMPVNNHSVLLAGVNDDLAVMRQLMRALLRIKVRPYYLFHCDPVIGAGHFRTSVWKGIEIMEGLRGHMSGLAIPTYVVDSPHGGGKIPVMPNYLISASDDAVVLRNYEGMSVRYQAQDKPSTTKATPTRGVSSLLHGYRSMLMPENNERMRRRALRMVSDPPRPGYTTNEESEPSCGFGAEGNGSPGCGTGP